MFLLLIFFIVILYILAIVIGYIISKIYIKKSYEIYLFKKEWYKKYLLENVVYKIDHHNGLVENYIDGMGLYYTLNNTFLTDCGNYKTLTATNKFFLIASEKEIIKSVPHEDFEDGSISYYNIKYFLYNLILYNYNGQIVSSDSVEVEYKNEFQDIKDLNNEYSILGMKFLYSKRTGVIKKIGDNKNVSVDSSGDVNLTYENGAIIKLNSHLEQI